MAFPTAQDGGPARGCHARHGWMPSGLRPEPSVPLYVRDLRPAWCTTSSAGGLEHGQMVAAREDRESFLGRLGLSLAATARLLGLSTSRIAKAAARAERPSVNNVPQSVPQYSGRGEEGV
jgi:hypothetical protein